MVWSQAHANLHTLLKTRILLPTDSRILMAVSGGQDSLCMARLLVDIQPYWRWTLGLIHCDHKWRSDSEANAAHVLAIAADWQIPAWCVAAEETLKSEAAARTWRYKTFAREARQKGYGYVVCGHTMSDRAETVLYNLVRGTGIDGIATLPWQRPIDTLDPLVTLARPLLSFARQDTAAFCQQQSISVWEDSTNHSLDFRRNRIRRELLPYLREHFNPQVERSLAQTLETATADTAYLEAQATAICARVVTCVRSTDKDIPPSKLAASSAQACSYTWKIHQKHLASEPLAMQRRVIRQVLRRALKRSLSFQHIDEVVRLLRSPNRSQCDSLPNGCIARVCKPFVLIKVIASLDDSHRSE